MGEIENAARKQRRDALIGRLWPLSVGAAFVPGMFMSLLVVSHRLYRWPFEFSRGTYELLLYGTLALAAACAVLMPVIWLTGSRRPWWKGALILVTSLGALVLQGYWFVFAFAKGPFLHGR